MIKTAETVCGFWCCKVSLESVTVKGHGDSATAAEGDAVKHLCYVIADCQQAIRELERAEDPVDRT